MASPHAERQLVLLSAGTAARRQAMREQARSMVALVDWERLTDTLRTRKLLTVTGPRIIELADGHASEDFAAAVEESIVAGRRHGSMLQLVTLRIMAMLAEAGIASSVLKGPLLGEKLYGDAGRRLSSDIDLLVPQEQLHAAVQVVRSLGYAAPTDYVQASGRPLLHFLLAHERGELPPVELHWRVHWYEERFARERLLPQGTGAPDDWRPAVVDELAAMLLFYARDGFVDLRLASDLGALWDLYGGQLDPHALRQLLQVYPALARVIATAVEVAEKVVGLPRAQIADGIDGLGPRERIAARLANPNPRSSPSQIYADIGLIDGLLAPPGGFKAFVRRQILPPSEILNQHAQSAARRRARSLFSRGAGTLGRYGLAMTRLVRAPETLR